MYNWLHFPQCYGIKIWGDFFLATPPPPSARRVGFPPVHCAISQFGLKCKLPWVSAAVHKKETKGWKLPFLFFLWWNYHLTRNSLQFVFVFKTLRITVYLNDMIELKLHKLVAWDSRESLVKHPLILCIRSSQASTADCLQWRERKRIPPDIHQPWIEDN